MSDPEKAKKTAGGCLVCIVLLALIGVVCPNSQDSRDSDDSPKGSSAGPHELDAWVMVQQFVKDQLRSPSTADFGSVFGDYQKPDDCVTKTGENTFQVRGWVDAQNAFGPTSRNNFSCELEYVGNDRWQCRNLGLYER